MRPRNPPKDGMIAAFEGLEAREDGKFTKGMASAIRQAYDALRDKINGYLSLGTGQHGAWTGNIDGWVGDVTFPSAPNTEMIVLHELGRAPRFMWPSNPDRAGHVYVSNWTGWGPQKIYVKSDVADLKVTLLLF